MLFTPDEARVRKTIEAMVSISGREIINTVNENGVWTLFIRQHTHIAFVMHMDHQQYMNVVFPCRFTDAEIIRKISDDLQNPTDLARFQYSLKSAITTPHSSFLIHTKDDNFAGFDILARIYPYEPGFALSHFDNAILTVVNAGVLGMAYIAIILGEKDLAQQVNATFGNASPEGMFG